ncbi:MAG: DUF4065 domain-containing protein [Patescibacteria group bacterium]|jgi:transcriptional regulator with XRE-family HTH domain|nr:DUF4065 domain-containing protein [Patescibacteria group bacterium]
MIKHLLVQKLRKKNGFSQSFVAEKIGVSRPTYEKIENGETELRISEAEKLSRLFGMSLQDLLANREESVKVKIIESKKKKSNKDIEIRVEEKDLKKFKQVLLYILEKVGAKPNVGETVVYKLLYFIDFDYYEKFEENLMGATYIKNHYGPTPVEFKKIVDKMQKDGELEMIKSKHFQYEQKKYLPLKSANLKNLSAQETSHIDDVLSRLAGKSAKELSAYSHTDTPWMIHEDGEKIRYESVFYRDNDHSVRNYEDEL